MCGVDQQSILSASVQEVDLIWGLRGAFVHILDKAGKGLEWHNHYIT